MKVDDRRCRKGGNGRESRMKGRSQRRAVYSDGEWVMTRVKHTPSLSGEKKRDYSFTYRYIIHSFIPHKHLNVDKALESIHFMKFQDTLARMVASARRLWLCCTVDNLSG